MTGVRFLAAALVLLGATLLLFARLGAASLDGDEVTYALVSRGCAEQGECVPPRIFGRPFLNKPPLLFWSMAASARILGASELAARLPAAASGLAVVVAVLWVGWRRFGAATGILAAALLGTTPGLLLNHGFRTAVTDGPLSLCVLIATVTAAEWRARAAGRWPWPTAAAVAVGVGFKGLIGPALLLAWLAAMKLIDLGRDRRERLPRRDGVLALAIVVPALVVFGAWLALLGASGGRQIGARVIGREIVERILRGVDPSHAAGPLFYADRLVADFGIFLAAAAVAVVAILRAARRASSPSSPDEIALVCWAVAPLAILHLSVSKLPWYAYPAYPAVALLAAWAAVRGLRRLRDSRPRILALAGLAVALGLRLADVAPALSAPPWRAPAHLLALRCEQRQPRPLLRIDPAVRFGPHGVRRHNAYYLTGASCAETGSRSAESGACRYFVTPRRPDPAPGATLATFPRYLPDEPTLYLVDECGGDLARVFPPLADEAPPVPAAVEPNEGPG